MQVYKEFRADGGIELTCFYRNNSDKKRRLDILFKDQDVSWSDVDATKI